MSCIPTSSFHIDLECHDLPSQDQKDICSIGKYLFYCCENPIRFPCSMLNQLSNQTKDIICGFDIFIIQECCTNS